VRPGIVDVAESPAAVRSTAATKALVVLIDFSDKPADRVAHDAAYFGVKMFGGPNLSLAAYFDEVSYGRFALDGDVVGWYRSPCRHADIVNRDGIAGTKDDHGLDTSSGALVPQLCAFPLNIWGVVKQAVEAAAADIDLCEYDNDGPDGSPRSGDDDGFVDALLVIHSGIGAEIRGDAPGSENFIWSLESSLDYYTPTRNTVIDGVRVGAFVIVPELGEIGVFAHEFCHLLGLPDLYSSATGESVVGPLCLMDGGAWNGPNSNGSVPSHLSAPMKYVLGWLEPTPVCLGCDGLPSIAGAALDPLGVAASAYALPGNPGGMDWSSLGGGRGEYFILENRQTDYGRFEAWLPASGLLIWKVDETRRDNNLAGGRLAEVIQADGGTVDGGTGSELPGEPSDFWPRPDDQDFTPYTRPSSALSGGRFSGVAVENMEPLPAGRILADLSVGLPRRGRAYAYPNPYSIADLRSGPPLRIVFVPETGPEEPFGFEVTVFDLEGRPVRRLAGPDEVLADGTALWDGRDDGGRLVRAGIYLYSIKASGQEATGTVAIKE
jgi:immune inhibitor A